MSVKEQRLYRQKGFALPFPEVLIAIVGLTLVVVFPEDRNFDLNVFATLALASAVIALPLGIPLVMVKIKCFWFDIAYVILGVMMVKFFVSLPDGAYIGEGLLVFIGASFVISGFSHALRRLLVSHSSERSSSK